MNKLRSNKFDIRQTNIAKGVALILLAIHHLFYNNPDNYDTFASVFVLNGVPIECLIANYAKVCVAIFLIMSGYGLTKSYSSYLSKSLNKGNKVVKSFKDALIYTKNRFIKLYSDFWLVYLVFVPLGLLFGHSFLTVYENNPINYISDFFGLSFFVHNGYVNTMNASWWFMSICIVFYALFPLLYWILDRFAEALLVFSLILIYTHFDYAQLKDWLFPFVVGMFFAKYNLFDKLSKVCNNQLNCILFSVFSIYICAKFRHYYAGDYPNLDGFFGTSIIILSFLVLSRIPVISKILEELGKYSGIIYMFHSFIYFYYFKSLIYSAKYSILILILLLAVCYIVARLLVFLQHLLRIDLLVNRLTGVKAVVK